jgi:hypothetical protein
LIASAGDAAEKVWGGSAARTLRALKTPAVSVEAIAAPLTAASRNVLRAMLMTHSNALKVTDQRTVPMTSESTPFLLPDNR